MVYKKVQISLKEEVLKELDDYAKGIGFSRSAFIALLVYEHGREMNAKKVISDAFEMIGKAGNEIKKDKK